MKKYFKCTLKTDIVINASLATEGNMKTLDYIPGSNFLGIIASAGNYEKWEKEGLAYDIFHSGAISFGDAHLSKDGNQSYAMPFSLFTNKLDTEVCGEKANVWIHHSLLNNNIRPQDDKDNYIQLKQYRSGYFNKNRDFIPRVKKRFALKSARDRKSRKSLDAAMFGFESMKANQEFIFSIEYENEKIDDGIIDRIVADLIGKQRIGKSKSAQYGQVEIEKIEKIENVDPFKNHNCRDNKLLIYAESNLAFFNKYGQPTFQPSPKCFGLDGLGEFDWAKSQIRTYSYSPWNGHRDTTDPQRDCIQKGSVLVFQFNELSQAKNPDLSQVGAFQSEGLGRVIYNPEFLNSKTDGKWDFVLRALEIKPDKTEMKTNEKEAEYKSDLAKFLLKKYKARESELAIGKEIYAFMNGKNRNDRTHKSILSDIPTSQWGGIRDKAFQTPNNLDLITALFGDKGMLTTGVAADLYWNKKGGLPRETLKHSIQNNSLGSIYVIKLAAEMAKWKQQYDISKK